MKQDNIICIQMNDELLKNLNIISKMQGISRSKYIKNVINEQIKKDIYDYLTSILKK